MGSSGCNPILSQGRSVHWNASFLNVKGIAYPCVADICVYFSNVSPGNIKIKHFIIHLLFFFQAPNTISETWKVINKCFSNEWLMNVHCFSGTWKTNDLTQKRTPCQILNINKLISLLWIKRLQYQEMCREIYAEVYTGHTWITSQVTIHLFIQQTCIWCLIWMWQEMP